MSDDERKRLADTRRLIFTNLANGVVVEDAMVAFKMGEEEILKHFTIVSRKIFEYRFERGLPYIKCDSPSQANSQRLALFHSLDRIGPTTLTSDFKLTRPEVHQINDSVRSGADDLMDSYAAKQVGR